MIKKNKLIFLNVVCLLLLSFLCVFAWSQLAASTQNFDNDYKTFYGALHHADNPYRVAHYVRVLSIKKQKNGKTQLHTTPEMSAVNMNSPTMTLFLKMLVNISNTLTTNVMIFVLASLWCAGLSLFILSRLFSQSHSNLYFLPLLLMLMLTWPALYTLKLGQVSFFLLPFLGLSFLFLWRRHFFLMSIFLGLVASLKLFFLIFALFFLLRKQWRLLLTFMVSFTAFFFLPLLYFKWIDYLAFFHIAHNFSLFANRATLPMNGSFLSVIANVVSFFQFKSSLIGIQVSLVIVSVYLVIRWMIYDRLFLQRLPEFSEAFSLSFLILMALLCSPLAWTYYFLFLTIPFVLFLKIARCYTLPLCFFMCFSAALLLPCLSWVVLPNVWVQLVVHLAGFVALIFWGICLHIAAKTVMQVQQTSVSSQKKLFWICAVYAMLNVFLLSVGYGMPYFFDFNQKNYLMHAPPAIQLSHPIAD